ncbi:MAG: hypothetical protein DHS20C18_27490 [Saprospiraceae bacterium]|nr:MAG: hypothetical protein DHS20C18_27490 [Saprospiraceae bacterium]
MDLITEFFVEIFFRRLIVGFFGYYTLFFIYKLFRHKRGLEWLEAINNSEGEEFGKGCLVAIIGLISFSSLFILIGVLYGLIFNQ